MNCSRPDRLRQRARRAGGKFRWPASASTCSRISRRIVSAGVSACPFALRERAIGEISDFFAQLLSRRMSARRSPQRANVHRILTHPMPFPKLGKLARSRHPAPANACSSSVPADATSAARCSSSGRSCTAFNNTWTAACPARSPAPRRAGTSGDHRPRQRALELRPPARRATSRNPARLPDDRHQRGEARGRTPRREETFLSPARRTGCSRWLQNSRLKILRPPQVAPRRRQRVEHQHRTIRSRDPWPDTRAAPPTSSAPSPPPPGTIEAKLLRVGKYARIPIDAHEGIGHFVAGAQRPRRPQNSTVSSCFDDPVHRRYRRTDAGTTRSRTRNAETATAPRSRCRARGANSTALDHDRADAEHRGEQRHVDRKVVDAELAQRNVRVATNRLARPQHAEHDRQVAPEEGELGEAAEIVPGDLVRLGLRTCLFSASTRMKSRVSVPRIDSIVAIFGSAVHSRRICAHSARNAP